jgi:hypothetical protein
MEELSCRGLVIPDLYKRVERSLIRKGNVDENILANSNIPSISFLATES